MPLSGIPFHGHRFRKRSFWPDYTLSPPEWRSPLVFYQNEQTQAWLLFWRAPQEGVYDAERLIVITPAGEARSYALQDGRFAKESDHVQRYFFAAD